MPLKVVDATVSDFGAVFDKFRSELPNHKANFILFLADKNPSTSLSWCPGMFNFFVFSPAFLLLLKKFGGSCDCPSRKENENHKCYVIDVFLHFFFLLIFKWKIVLILVLSFFLDCDCSCFAFLHVRVSLSILSK